MWTSKLLFFFLLIVAVQSVKFLNVSHIKCVEITADKVFSNGQAGNLKDAFEKCVNAYRCMGINKTSDTTFQLLEYVYGYKLTSSPTNYYIFDRNNGTSSLPNAPSKLDAAMLFSLYINGECPAYAYMLQNSICSGTTPEIVCKKFPSYMNATFDSATANCTVIPKSAVIKAWS